MNISLSAFVPENLVSRDGFGTPVPRQPAHLHTQAEYGAYLRDSSRVPRHTPSGQSRVYRIMQLRTDGVHCRESAGTGISFQLIQQTTGYPSSLHVFFFFSSLSFATEGGRRFMAAWRKEEEDAARHRQKREATRLGKLLSHTEA